MTYQKYTTPLRDAAHLWGIRHEEPEPLPLTVGEAFGTLFNKTLVITESRPAECPNCRKTGPTVDLIREIAKSRNIICCKVPL
jgi:hypothetical protein